VASFARNVHVALDSPVLVERYFDCRRIDDPIEHARLLNVHLGNLPVHSALIHRPASGAWGADKSLDASEISGVVDPHRRNNHGTSRTVASGKVITDIRASHTIADFIRP